MKARSKSKRRVHHAAASTQRARRPIQFRRKHPAAKPGAEIAPETYTPMETGSPDRDEGRGPLGQEGEGEAQNDQLAALEETEPDEG